MSKIKTNIEELKKQLETAKEQLRNTQDAIKFEMVRHISNAETLEDLNELLEAFRESGETDADILTNFDAQMPFVKYTQTMYITPEGLLTFDYSLMKFIMYTSTDKPVVQQDTEFTIDEG